MYTRKCIYQRQDPEDRLKVLGPSNIPLHIEKKKFKTEKLSREDILHVPVGYDPCLPVYLY